MYNYSIYGLIAMLIIVIIVQSLIINHQDKTIESLKAKFNYIVWGDYSGKKN